MLVALTALLALQVYSQLTVDDNGGSCESSTSDEVVNLIKAEWKDVRQIKEDLKDVKAACASNQQQSDAVDTSGLCE